MRVDLKVTGFDHVRSMLTSDARRIPGAIKKVQAKLAMHVMRQIREGVRSGFPRGGEKFAPNAASTIAQKRSSKPLINHGDLLRSINATQEGGVWFVGVHRNAKAKDGRDMWNIAEIHEFGTDPFDIPVTAKLRGWWFAMVKKGIFDSPLSPKTTVIKHPGIVARPFLRPVWDIFAREAEGLWREWLAKEMRW